MQSEKKKKEEKKIGFCIKQCQKKRDKEEISAKPRNMKENQKMKHA